MSIAMSVSHDDSPMSPFFQWHALNDLLTPDVRSCSD